MPWRNSGLLFFTMFLQFIEVCSPVYAQHFNPVWTLIIATPWLFSFATIQPWALCPVAWPGFSQAFICHSDCFTSDSGILWYTEVVYITSSCKTTSNHHPSINSNGNSKAVLSFSFLKKKKKYSCTKLMPPNIIHNRSQSQYIDLTSGLKSGKEGKTYWTANSSNIHTKQEVILSHSIYAKRWTEANLH